MSPPTISEALSILVSVIDLHIFRRGDDLEINPLFLDQFAEAVQDAREALIAKE